MNKAVSLFITFIIFCSTAFSDNEQSIYLNKIREYYADFNTKRIQYTIDSFDQTDIQRERSFKALYSDYLQYYDKVSKFFNAHPDIELNEKYAKENINEYAEYGIGFNIYNGFWYFIPDYKMLIETPEIPKTWAKWLALQEKFTTDNVAYCIKESKKGNPCSDRTMTLRELERAIVELEKVENGSDVLYSINTADYNYIPYTSFDLLRQYFYGTETDENFDEKNNEPQKVNKAQINSFKHFIKKYPESKYNETVKQYYHELKRDKFVITDETALRLFSELQNIRSF